MEIYGNMPIGGFRDRVDKEAAEFYRNTPIVSSTNRRALAFVPARGRWTIGPTEGARRHRV